jgi:hypothetical protein
MERYRTDRLHQSGWFQLLKHPCVHAIFLFLTAAPTFDPHQARNKHVTHANVQESVKRLLPGMEL